MWRPSLLGLKVFISASCCNLWAESPLSSCWSRRSKGGSAWIGSSLWSRWRSNLWTGQSCFLSSNWFSECEHPFIDKRTDLTEPAVPSTGPWGLGLKLYPSNMQRMRNEDLNRFLKSFLSTPQSSKWKKGSDSRVFVLIQKKNLIKSKILP